VAHELAESGVDQRLVAAAGAAGWERLTALQAAAWPVLRRGGNAVLHASTGAGVTGAFGLPVLDRLAQAAPGRAADADAAPGDAAADEAAADEAAAADDAAARQETGAGAGPRALVVAATPDRAQSLASALARLAAGTDVAVRAAAAGWRADGADVLVTTPDRAMGDIGGSALKLGALQVLVVLDLSDQLALQHGEALNTISSLVPRDAQRIIVSASLEGEAERFIETHVRRALTIPARAADPASEQPREAIGQLGYLVLDEAEKPALLARLLEGVEGDVLVHARTADRAGHVLAELSRRGMLPAQDASVRVVAFGAGAAAASRVVSYDVPFSADELRRMHEGGGTVFVTPAELQHFRRIAAQVPFTLKQRRARTFEPTSLDAFRDSIRDAVQREDLAAQMLVLEPLLDEHSHAEVAAALCALLRQRAPRGGTGDAGGTGGAGAAAVQSTAGPPPKQAGTGGFTRLFISVGSKDNIRPGDLVGAITGEAGIKGEQVGRVDIRETFSVVEVAAPAAERVIRALNGTTMRGRAVRVDYDRKTSGGDGPPRGGQRGAGPGRGPGGPRGPGGSGRGPGGPGGGPPRRKPPSR
jgi:ATP-dependent RNA helicase DeaD